MSGILASKGVRQPARRRQKSKGEVVRGFRKKEGFDRGGVWIGVAQKKRRYQRDAAVRQAIRQAFVNGERPIVTAEWTTAVVIEAARQRRDIVGCAIACIEQGRDDGEIVQALANYLSGYWTIWVLESTLKNAGYTPANNVIPFVPLSGRRSG